MSDTIWGEVIDVIDGDTFDLNVTHVDDDNEYEYNDIERIRIADIDAPELNGESGDRALEELEDVILDESIRCDIHARDRYGRLICDVYLE